jgi:hypothetical protein
MIRRPSAAAPSADVCTSIFHWLVPGRWPDYLAEMPVCVPRSRRAGKHVSAPFATRRELWPAVERDPSSSPLVANSGARKLRTAVHPAPRGAMWPLDTLVAQLPVRCAALSEPTQLRFTSATTALACRSADLAPFG